MQKLQSENKTLKAEIKALASENIKLVKDNERLKAELDRLKANVQNFFFHFEPRELAAGITAVHNQVQVGTAQREEGVKQALDLVHAEGAIISKPSQPKRNDLSDFKPYLHLAHIHSTKDTFAELVDKLEGIVVDFINSSSMLANNLSTLMVGKTSWKEGRETYGKSESHCALKTRWTGRYAKRGYTNMVLLYRDDSARYEGKFSHREDFALRIEKTLHERMRDRLPAVWDCEISDKAGDTASFTNGVVFLYFAYAVKMAESTCANMPATPKSSTTTTPTTPTTLIIPTTPTTPASPPPPTRTTSMIPTTPPTTPTTPNPKKKPKKNHANHTNKNSTKIASFSTNGC